MRQGGHFFGIFLAIIISHYFSSSIVVQCVVVYENPAVVPRQATLAELQVFDPSRKITCLGARSSIPRWAREDGHSRSMQQLCADPLYGGNSTRPNFRGYCQDGDVFFGPTNLLESPFRQFQPQNSFRSYLECRTRCFCNDNLDNTVLPQQPKEVADSRRTFKESDDLHYQPTYLIQLDKPRSPVVSSSQMKTRIYYYNKTEIIPPADALLPGQDLAVDMARARTYEDQVAIVRANRIKCGGPLPSFSLPPPFDVHDFANNEELCAVQLSGGNPAANAGAYCHRISTDAKVVSFADDMTPRLDWTWGGAGGSALRFSSSIRFHCWKNCICQERGRIQNYSDPLIPLWQFLANKIPDLSVGKGSKYPLGSSTDSANKPRTQIKGAEQPSADCAAPTDGEANTCSLPWPVDILGPVPKAVMALGLPQPPPITTSVDKEACNNACSSNNDCGPDCVCMHPSVLEAHTLGVELVSTTALCLGIDSLFGRSLESQGQVECLCNATYSAPACCHSRNGMIEILQDNN